MRETLLDKQARRYITNDIFPPAFARQCDPTGNSVCWWQVRDLARACDKTSVAPRGQYLEDAGPPNRPLLIAEPQLPLIVIAGDSPIERESEYRRRIHRLEAVFGSAVPNPEQRAIPSSLPPD